MPGPERRANADLGAGAGKRPGSAADRCCKPVVPGYSEVVGIRHRLFAGALVVMAGLVAWARLPVDAFPDVTNIQVMVLSKAQGLSASWPPERSTVTPLDTRTEGNQSTSGPEARSGTI